MYPAKETGMSFEYLEKVVSVLDEPICLIGGWAVYFTVNQNYKASTGKDYIGSRDIDLGFHIDEKQELGKSAFGKAVKKLEEEGFKEVGGRMVKDLDYDTGKEVKSEEAKTKPMYELQKMYVDLMVDHIPENMQDKEKMVFDEELLTYVFDDEKHREELEQFNKKLWMPQPHLLLAMKIKVLPGRQKDHKREKDIADIAAILLFRTQGDFPQRLLQVYTKEKILDSLKGITLQEIGKTEQLLGVATNSFNTTLSSLIRQVERELYEPFEEMDDWKQSIETAIRMQNARKLETILETISEKSHGVPLFHNKKFRFTIFETLNQKRIFNAQIANLLINIIYTQRTYKNLKKELTDYKVQLHYWVKSDGVGAQSLARGLEMLLIGGNLSAFSDLIKTKNENVLLDALDHMNIRANRNEIDKNILQKLTEWVSEQMDNQEDDGYTKRFHKLYKILKR